MAVAFYSAQDDSRSVGATTLPTEQNSSVVLYDVIDTSKSARELLPTWAGERGRLAVRVPSGTWWTAFRVDRQVRELASKPMPASSRELLMELKDELAPLNQADNTYLDGPFCAVARRAAKLSGRCVVLFSTDGFGENMSKAAHHRVREAAASLARNRHVLGVFMEGIDPINMERLRSDLQPLEGKLRFFATGKLDLEAIADLLNGGAK